VTPKPITSETAGPVSNAATQDGPSAQSGASEDLGRPEEIRSFNRRALFLGGCQKSGTTLLLSLLDGHPQLTVLPEETHFLEQQADYAALGSYQAKSRRLLEKSDLPLLGGRKPGQIGKAPSADVRDYSGFDHQRFTRLAALFVEQPGMSDSLVFSETIRAYAVTAGCDWQGCVRWVEKSTCNELCSGDLFRLFPDAKLIHVVRDPRGVFASVKRRLLNRSGNYTKAHRLVRGWNRSCRLIPKLLARGDQYLVVRYEDLVLATQRSLERICRFIGIEFLPELFAPTRAGRQWQGNSSFHEAFTGISAQSIEQWKKDLTEEEIWWVEMHCREGMRLTGYPFQSAGSFSLTRWLRRLPGETWGGYLRARRASLCQQAGLLEHCRYDKLPAALQVGDPSALITGNVR
jgi:hypothetical protein